MSQPTFQEHLLRSSNKIISLQTQETLAALKFLFIAFEMKPFQETFYKDGIFFNFCPIFKTFIAFNLECENQPCSSVVVGTVTLVLVKLRRYAPFHLNLRLPSTPQLDRMLDGWRNSWQLVNYIVSKIYLTKKCL